MIETVTETVNRSLRVVEPRGVQEPPVTLPTWRRDPRLVEVYEEFAGKFNPNRRGPIVSLNLNLPTEYAALGQPLIDTWGLKDRDWPREYNIEGFDKPERTYDLYRDGVGKEWVATVKPGALRSDETIMVATPEAASQVFQILFDMHNRRMSDRGMMDRLNKAITEKVLTSAILPINDKQPSSGVRPIGEVEIFDREEEVIEAQFTKGKIDGQEREDRIKSLPTEKVALACPLKRNAFLEEPEYGSNQQPPWSLTRKTSLGKI
jgi:hypothetical protein